MEAVRIILPSRGPGRWSIVVQIKSTCIQLITVQDTTKPCDYILSKDTTINCNTPIDSLTLLYRWPQQIIARMCLRISSRQMSRPMVAGPDNFTITRTWTVIDSCSNQNTCIQKIMVQDTTKPTITLCPKDTTITITDRFIDGTLTATDNCTDILDEYLWDRWRPMVAVRVKFYHHEGPGR